MESNVNVLPAFRVTYKMRPTARKVFTAIRFGSAAGTIEGCTVLSVEPVAHPAAVNG